MSYTLYQKKSHITELQKYLFSISFFNCNIPRIIPDGFYGSETASAVRAFQHEYGLTENGITDNQTWTKLIAVYRSFANAKPEPVYAFPQSASQIKIGDNGFPVYILQSMLAVLGDTSQDFSKIPISGSFDRATADALRKFQSSVNLSPSGFADSRTWNLLAKTVKSISFNP
ncbi:MAG: peptidoglycan-binding protein [Ruminococcus sp.]|jgi:peptidoglycan hydrolase-like protein with peptidoglycan-binding domain|nr:peptidoglycan-binding protein [Ruminococcus sp.]